MAILYVRGVNPKHIKKLNKDAKVKGYKSVGAYLNALFSKKVPNKD